MSNENKVQSFWRDAAKVYQEGNQAKLLSFVSEKAMNNIAAVAASSKRG